MESSPNYWMLALRMLGSLALLMYGMKAISDALQKMAGPQLRHILGAMTTNRFTGMLTGVFVTAAVQSSTATTVMTVSFVSAGLLTLAQAISVIMGANIGTTLTAWIMSAGFSFNITDFVYPAFFIAIILIYNKKRRVAGDFIYGIAFMFLGLGTLRQTGIDMQLGQNEAVLSFFSSFDPDSFVTTITFLLIGGLLTMCVQSSAAVMAITMILCSSGVLPIYQGIALVMGENIGTTVTSNIVAMSAGTQARRAAFAHMFFNLFGVVWVLCAFKPFVNVVCSYVGYDVETLALSDFDGEVVRDYYGRDAPKPAHGKKSFAAHTNSSKMIVESAVSLFEKIANQKWLVRRINITANNVISQNQVQPGLFDGLDEKDGGTNHQKEDNLQRARLEIIRKFGKNAILKGTNLEEGATTRDRNEQIGGHKA